jgi:hypothetical protein
MRKCLAVLAMASSIAVGAVVTPVTAADARWRRAASVYGYEPYYGYRYPAYYRLYRRPYEYDHHYGLSLYGPRRGAIYQVPSTCAAWTGCARR